MGSSEVQSGLRELVRVVDELQSVGEEAVDDGEVIQCDVFVRQGPVGSVSDHTGVVWQWFKEEPCIEIWSSRCADPAHPWLDGAGMGKCMMYRKQGETKRVKTGDG